MGKKGAKEQWGERIWGGDTWKRRQGGGVVGRWRLEQSLITTTCEKTGQKQRDEEGRTEKTKRSEINCQFTFQCLVAWRDRRREVLDSLFSSLGSLPNLAHAPSLDGEVWGRCKGRREEGIQGEGRGGRGREEKENKFKREEEREKRDTERKKIGGEGEREIGRERGREGEGKRGRKRGQCHDKGWRKQQKFRLTSMQPHVGSWDGFLQELVAGGRNLTNMSSFYQFQICFHMQNCSAFRIEMIDLVWFSSKEM